MGEALLDMIEPSGITGQSTVLGTQIVPLKGPCRLSAELPLIEREFAPPPPKKLKKARANEDPPLPPKAKPKSKK